MQADLSPARRVAQALVARHGASAPEVFAELFGRLRVTQRAALLYDWRGYWARPKQLIEQAGAWRSWGFCTGRGYGKTRAIAEYLTSSVQAGDARRIALIAQQEDEAFRVMVDGPSGLIAVAPPWFRPRWEREELCWPNGAKAFVYTPEKPGNLRGPEHDHAWASELVAWPPSTRDEAFSNLRLGLRKRAGRLLWDTTPRRRHPLIRYLLERSAKYPDVHVVVRGAMRENADNLTPEVVAELEAEYGGTRRGQEELEGIFFDESDGALWKQEWIDQYRRALPMKLKRRIIALDPGRSSHEGSDPTGDIELGLGIDDQVHVLADFTEKRLPSVWVPHVIDRYVAGKCDCIVVEEESGGFFIAETIRLHAEQRGLSVTLVKKEGQTRHAPNMINVRSINTQQKSKADRAQTVAAAYERGRVSHTEGVDLSELEDELTTWEPPTETRRHASPNRLDALVHGVRDLLDLYDERPDHRAGFVGITEANKRLQAPAAGGSLASLLIGGRGGGRTI